MNNCGKAFLVLFLTLIILLTGLRTTISMSSPGRQPTTDAGVGQLAPDFILKKLNGGSARLSDYRGQVVIIDFWATWCPPCRKGIPDFIKLYREYSGQGLMIIGVSLDQGGKHVLKSFAKKYQVNYPILLTDGKVDKAYGGIKGIPTTFIVDREGKIYKKYIGLRPKRVFEADIKKLLEKD